jgi:hypothetical protein
MDARATRTVRGGYNTGRSDPAAAEAARAPARRNVHSGRSDVGLRRKT